MQNEEIPLPDGRLIFERLLEAYGCSTMQELALAMLENLSTVKGWKQRGSVPIEYCARAALHTKCSLDWLVLGLGPMRIQSKASASSSPADDLVRSVNEEEALYAPALHYRTERQQLSYVLVPRYRAKSSPGAERAEGDVFSGGPGEVAFEAGWMRRTFGRAGGGFALLDVAGNSMEPTLWDGETIVVDLQSCEIASGGIYALLDGDELLVKRLQRLIGGGVEVLSDNANFTSQLVDDPAQLSVIGRLVWPRVR